ncbi:GNAT family N-acetyltransferase [Collibacillus ludicampi]|uniref:GNAT family N-acetyltransferase n=1 Tax=Collibacillus ludicampi TaxID=2771369 RepID=UPI0034E28A5A
MRTLLLTSSLRRKHPRSGGKRIQIQILQARGVGRALFTHALQRASHLDAKYMEWAAERHAVGFYEHMGGKHILDYPTRLEGPIRFSESE